MPVVERDALRAEIVRIVKAVGGQSEAARRTGVAQDTISRWTLGSQPSVLDFAKFCEGLGASIDAILLQREGAELPGFRAGQLAERDRLRGLIAEGEDVLGR